MGKRTSRVSQDSRSQLVNVYEVAYEFDYSLVYKPVVNEKSIVLGQAYGA